MRALPGFAVACSGSSTSSGEGGELADMTPAERKGGAGGAGRPHARELAAQRERLHREHARARGGARAAARRARDRGRRCAPTSRTRRRRRAAQRRSAGGAAEGGARGGGARGARGRGAARRARRAAHARRAVRAGARPRRRGARRRRSSAELLSGSPHSAELARHLENAQTIVNAVLSDSPSASGRRRSRSRSPRPRRGPAAAPRRQSPRRRRPRRRRPRRRRPHPRRRRRRRPRGRRRHQRRRRPHRSPSPPAAAGVSTRQGRRRLASRSEVAGHAAFSHPGARVAEGRRSAPPPNQDAFFVLRIDDHNVAYGVFDGHGHDNGAHAAHRADDPLASSLLTPRIPPAAGTLIAQTASASVEAFLRALRRPARPFRAEGGAVRRGLQTGAREVPKGDHRRPPELIVAEEGPLKGCRWRSGRRRTVS